MIELQNLSFAYRGHSSIFEGFELRIERGEAWSIIGPSGCGKTTLLYLIAGLRRPTGGHILIGGTPVMRPRPESGLVLQDHGLLPWATVRENASLGLRVQKFYGPDGKHAPSGIRLKKTDLDQRVAYWLKRLGIEDLQDKYPSQLSRGQRQRTAIARTLAMKPDLLLMDEPFSALDAAIREDLQKTMMAFHNESDLSHIIVTHDIEEAVFVGEKILLLRGEANREFRIIQNNAAGLDDFRNQIEFRERCDYLRELLGELT
jgi:ABC-type nitrate/sulfonate/bicarbonate transport system ATPase subunit